MWNQTGNRAIPLMIIPFLLAACADPLGHAKASRFEATVEGAVRATYEGAGDFHAGSDPRVGEPMVFTLSSEGAEAGTSQSFILHRRGGGIPAVGSYVLGPLESVDGRPQGFTAYYSRRGDNRLEAYAARSGELEITVSSAERVEGRFRFTGSLYCSRALQGSERPVGSCDPGAISPDAPSVEVAGSFVAARMVTPVAVPES